MNPIPTTHKMSSAGGGVPADTTYIQYKGVWDMQDLYEFVASFFHSHKFKFYELRYIMKKPGPFGAETNS